MNEKFSNCRNEIESDIEKLKENSEKNFTLFKRIKLEFEEIIYIHKNRTTHLESVF